MYSVVFRAFSESQDHMNRICVLQNSYLMSIYVCFGLGVVYVLV